MASAPSGRQPFLAAGMKAFLSKSDSTRWPRRLLHAFGTTADRRTFAVT